MLYCPQCGAEYREGFSSCSDCHVLLTRERLSASQADLNKEFRVVWRGTDQQECVSVCYQLQDEARAREIIREIVEGTPME